MKNSGELSQGTRSTFAERVNVHTVIIKHVTLERSVLRVACDRLRLSFVNCVADVVLKASRYGPLIVIPRHCLRRAISKYRVTGSRESAVDEASLEIP